MSKTRQIANMVSGGTDARINIPTFSTTVNNALFVGSTADLQKMLKNAGKDLNT